MQILLTGANGFIGTHIYKTLMNNGHTVIAAVRNPGAFTRKYPGAEAIAIDMNRDVESDTWPPRLENIDAVINCAGALQSGRGQNLQNIHFESPKALFTACQSAGIRRVIQVSAISADDEAGTEFARSKKAADDFLRTLDLDWMVLRPSLVYEEGSFGGTSTLRGLAGLPGIIPLVGRADAAFQPLHADDLAKGICWLLDNPSVSQVTLEPAGPEKLTTRELVESYRRWLGFGAARIFHLPRLMQKLLARLGDLFGVAAINSTSLRQLDYGNTTDSDWTTTVPITCRSLDEAMQAHPAQVQDRWHARLYFLKPLARMALVALWLGSALAGSLMETAKVAEWIAPFGLPASSAPFVQWFAVALDAVMALWLLSGRRLALAYALQFWLVAAYTLVFTFAQPNLWLDPLGQLLKNLPILALLVFAWATAEER